MQCRHYLLILLGSHEIIIMKKTTYRVYKIESMISAIILKYQMPVLLNNLIHFTPGCMPPLPGPVFWSALN